MVKMVLKSGLGFSPHLYPVLTVASSRYWDESGGEPNNHQSGGLHGEDCAVLNSHTKSWYDVPCDHLYKHICEMDAITVN